MITIVDYGMGNLRSVQKAFERVDYPARVITSAAELDKTDLLVVPGVGAFDRAVLNLQKRGLFDPVIRYIEDQRPYLGICLGLQLLFERSEEGERDGFGVLEGNVKKFRDVSPVPHMGWNDVKWVNRGEPLRPKKTSAPCYYFVHSYYPEPVNEDVLAGITEYGGEFCAAIRFKNCIGVQFHPEKSQHAGLDLLRKISKNAHAGKEISDHV